MPTGLTWRPSRGTSAAIASAALLLPASLAASTSPSPNHPRVMLWYRTLRQPFFKPPDAAIPMAWSVIEACLARAAYGLLRSEPSAARDHSLALLAANVAMIGGWSRLFFGVRSLPASTVAAAAMTVSGAAFVRVAKAVDPAAARAGVPFVAWVAFATVLTGTIWALNRHR
jgi:translocator protein